MQLSGLLNRCILCFLIFFLLSFLPINFLYAQDANVNQDEICSEIYPNGNFHERLDVFFDKLLESEVFNQIQKKDFLKTDEKLGKTYIYRFYVDDLLLFQIVYNNKIQKVFAKHYLYCGKEDIREGECDKLENLFDYDLRQDTCVNIYKNIGNSLKMFMLELLENTPTITTLMQGQSFYYPVLIHFKTDRPALCRFDNEDKDFDQLRFSTSSQGEMLENHKYCYELGLEGSNSIYIRCIDKNSNKNLISKVISFNILRDIGYNEKEIKADFYFVIINDRKINVSYDRFKEILSEKYNKNIYLVALKQVASTELIMYEDKDNYYYQNYYNDTGLTLDKSHCSVDKKLIHVVEGATGSKLIITGALTKEPIEQTNLVLSLFTRLYSFTLRDPAIVIIKKLSPDILQNQNTVIADLVKILVQVFLLIIYFVVLVFIVKFCIRNFRLLLIKFPRVLYQKVLKPTFDISSKVLGTKYVGTILKLIIVFVLSFVVYWAVYIIVIYLATTYFSTQDFWDSKRLIIAAILFVTFFSIIFPIINTVRSGKKYILGMLSYVIGLILLISTLLIFGLQLSGVYISQYFVYNFTVPIIFSSFVLIFGTVKSLEHFKNSPKDFQAKNILHSFKKRLVFKVLISALVLFPIYCFVLICIASLYQGDFLYLSMLSSVYTWLYMIVFGVISSLLILPLILSIKGNIIEKSIIIGASLTSIFNIYIISYTIIVYQIITEGYNLSDLPFSMVLMLIIFCFLWGVILTFYISSPKILFGKSIQIPKISLKKPKRFDIKFNKKIK